MENYNNDQPITSTTTDKLNRSSFSKEIANLLVLEANEPCLTISLEGKWGDGKTSILNMVKETIQTMPIPPIIVEYNAWVNGKPESLIQDFLIQFTSQLGLVDHPKEGQRIAKELLAYSKLFSVVKLIPGAEPWGTLVEKIFNRFGNATKSISDLKELNVTDKKAQVEKQLNKLNRPIIVIIDDIDRLTPQESFQVLRLVKAVADFPRTAFILSFEPSYLESVLAHNNIDNAHEYIDKIVQLRISVPSITTKDLNILVDEHFDKFTEHYNFDHYQDDRDRFSYIYRQYLQRLITSPRDVKRILNHFTFVYNLVQYQVCIADLFVLSVIAVKAQKIYNHIKSNPTQYAIKGDSENFDLVFLDRDKTTTAWGAQLNLIYEELGLSENNIYNDLLAELFPAAFKKVVSVYEVQDADAAGRVDNINRLFTALHTSTPKRSVSDKYVIDYIESLGIKFKLIEDAIFSGATKRFLELFEILLFKIEPDVEKQLLLIRVIVDVLLRQNQLNGYNNIYSGVFSGRSFYENISQLLNRILRNSTTKESVMTSIMEQEVLIPFASHLLCRLKAQYNAKSHEEPWLNENIVDDLIEQYTLKAQRILKDNSLHSGAMEYRLIHILWRYNKEDALNIIKEIDQSDVLRLGWLLLDQVGADSSNGSFLSVNLKKAQETIDINMLRKDAKKILETKELSIEDKAISNSIIDGERHYLNGGIVTDW